MQVPIQFVEFNIKSAQFVCLIVLMFRDSEDVQFDYATVLKFDKCHASQAFMMNSDDSVVEIFCPRPRMHRSIPLPIRNQPSHL